MVRVLVCLLPVLCLLFTTGGGNKANVFLISIHEEATADEAPKFATPIKLGPEAKQYYFKKVATFTDHDIAYYYPFISQDGQTYGAALKLKNKGSEGLKSLSLTHQGKLLGCRFSPSTFSAIFIDRPIDHGTIVIWSGLSKSQIKELGKKFPHAEQVQRALGGGGEAASVAPAPAPAAAAPAAVPAGTATAQPLPQRTQLR